MSTRMEHVQTKSIDYYSPLCPPILPPPLPTPFDCCIAPLSTPSSYALSVFCWFFKKQYIQPSKCHWYEPMASRRSLPMHKHETINAPGQQDVLLTGSLTTQKGRHRSGKGQSRPGAFGKANIPLFLADGVSMLFICRPE